MDGASNCRLLATKGLPEEIAGQIAREEIAMSVTTTSQGSAIARLGYVLNWTGILAGLALGGFIAFCASPLGAGWMTAFGIGAFIMPYAIGRALRFILAGR